MCRAASGQCDRTAIGKNFGWGVQGQSLCPAVEVGGHASPCLSPSLQLKAPGAATHPQASPQWQPSAKVA